MQPKHFKPAGLLALLVFAFTFFSAFTSPDLLDGVKNNTKLVNDLKDLYRAFNINHILDSQREDLTLAINTKPMDEVNALLSAHIRTCDSLKQMPFYNKALAAEVNTYLSATIRNYTVAQDKGTESQAFKADAASFKTASDRYLAYLYKNYGTSQFIMSEQEYWQLNDKKNYAKSADYAAYLKLKADKATAGATLLKNAIKQAGNFQEASIYEIELADQYVKHPDTLSTDATELAINKYKSILDKQQYSIYLFETWLKWRVVTQQHYNGLDVASTIPNDVYNKERERAALTILTYISSHPTNKMAINEFLTLSTHDVVKRFGAYPHGNQNTVEYHEIFDEK